MANTQKEKGNGGTKMKRSLLFIYNIWKIELEVSIQKRELILVRSFGSQHGIVFHMRKG